MTTRDEYSPQPAGGATIEKDGESWTLVLVRELGHRPERVWAALTEPDQLMHWSPFDADGSLAVAGAQVKLTTVGAPASMVSHTVIVRAEAPRVLQFNWGDREVRWELEATTNGTRLTLWNNIDRNFIAMGAAGWHLCLEVLGLHLAGTPLGRIIAGEAMRHPGWQRLHTEYQHLFRQDIEEDAMGSIVDYVKVSTVGLESSPVASALAGLRANEARYYNTKYKHVFTTVPAAESQDTLAYVNNILKTERKIEFASKPLETSMFVVEGIKMAYVFYESGLAINVMYTLEDAGKRAVGLKLSDGMEVPLELVDRFKFARQKSKLAGTIRGSFFVIKGQY